MTEGDDEREARRVIVPASLCPRGPRLLELRFGRLAPPEPEDDAPPTDEPRGGY